VLDADRRIDLDTATDEEKLQEIRRQLVDDALFSPTAIGAWDVWLSFGDRLREIASANIALWERQVKATPALVATSPRVKKWRDALKLDAERFARIAKDAKTGRAAARTQTAGRLRNLQREMRNRLNDLEKLADKRLRELRDKAGLGQALTKEEMEAMQDAIAFQASVSSLARQVDGYSMAILEVLEGAERAVDRRPRKAEEPEPVPATP
jgi:hypothetical protein